LDDTELYVSNQILFCFAKTLFELAEMVTKRDPTVRGRRGRDRIVVGFTTTCAISAYHYLSSNPTLCDKVCQ